MASYQVSPGALLDLSNQLNAIYQDMQGAGSAVSGHQGASGSRQVDDSLSSFISNWHDGIGHIQDHMSTAISMLRDSAKAYSDTDAAICKAATPQTSP
jgi:uncharacterized protein YukE